MVLYIYLTVINIKDKGKMCLHDLYALIFWGLFLFSQRLIKPPQAFQNPQASQSFSNGLKCSCLLGLVRIHKRLFKPSQESRKSLQRALKHPQKPQKSLSRAYKVLLKHKTNHKFFIPAYACISQSHSSCMLKSRRFCICVHLHGLW